MCVKLCVLVIGQVAEPQVNRLCIEAQELMVMNKWVELASLMLTSADLIFSKVAEKGVNALFSMVFMVLADNILKVFCVSPKNSVKYHSTLVNNMPNEFAICYWLS